MSLWQLVGVSAQVEVTSGNLTLTEPAGVQSGDLLVASISYRSNAAFTTPAGWSNAASENTGNTTVNGTGSIASGHMDYIVRGGSAPALVWNRTLGDLARGCILAYRRTDGGVPVFQAASDGTAAVAGTAVSITGLTTVEEDTLLIMACCGARNITSSAQRAATDPVQANWTEHSDGGSTNGADGALAVASAIKDTAGATGNFQWTASTSARHVTIVGSFRAKYNIKANNGSYATSGQSVVDPGLVRDYIGFVSAAFGTVDGSERWLYEDVPIGTAAADRVVVILGSVTNSADFSLSAASIGGIAAEIMQETLNPSAGVHVNSFAIAANVPTGTVADVILDYSVNASAMDDNPSPYVWTVLGAATSTIFHDMDSDYDTSGDGTVTVTIDIPEDGAAFACTFGDAYGSNVSTQWTGLSEDDDTAVSFFVSSAASGSFLSESLGHAITSNDDGTGPLLNAKFVVAASVNPASGAAVLTAEFGSLATSGQTAALLYARVVPFAHGTYTLTGQVAALNYGRLTLADFGLYATAGQDVALVKSISFQVDFGTYTYTGQSVTFTFLEAFTWIEADGTDGDWTEQAAGSSSWTEPSPLTNSYVKQTALPVTWSSPSSLGDNWIEEDPI